MLLKNWGAIECSDQHRMASDQLKAVLQENKCLQRVVDDKVNVS